MRLLLTMLAVLVMTAVAGLLPGAAFLAGVPLVTDDALAPTVEAIEAARAVRLQLTDRYFQWAVVTISICGAIMLRGTVVQTRILILASFVLAAVSILSGVGYLELVVLGLSLGIPDAYDDPGISFYPTIQFFAVVGAFLFACSAALWSLSEPARR